MSRHTKTKPTPAPWYYVAGAVWNCADLDQPNARCIAQRASATDLPPTEKDANMRLCAKAQEMRHLLVRFVGAADYHFRIDANEGLESMLEIATEAETLLEEI